jgi:multidrug efflux system membrane fusion protein
MKAVVRATLALLILAAIAGALVWGFLSHRSEQSDSEDAPIEAASRIAQQNGRTVLNFDPQAQRANGIVVTALASSRRSASVQANGVVLELQPLLDLQASLNAARMNIARARSAARASQAESTRLLGLNHASQNVSQKAVEAAQALAGSDAATLTNAQQSLTVLENSIELHWGKALAGWIEQDSPQFKALLAQREYLLQVTPTSVASGAAPREAMATLPSGAHVAAHLIGAVPQVDPRLQVPSQLYLLPAHAGVVPGLNLPIALPAGPEQKGVVVPYSAIVWMQGNAWCYTESAPGKFTRTPVPTGDPTPSGWFVSNGIAPGTEVVTAGAQTVYSEEFRNQIQADED